MAPAGQYRTQSPQPIQASLMTAFFPEREMAPCPQARVHLPHPTHLLVTTAVAPVAVEGDCAKEPGPGSPLEAPEAVPVSELVALLLSLQQDASEPASPSAASPTAQRPALPRNFLRSIRSPGSIRITSLTSGPAGHPFLRVPQP